MSGNWVIYSSIQVGPLIHTSLKVPYKQQKMWNTSWAFEMQPILGWNVEQFSSYQQKKQTKKPTEAKECHMQLKLLGELGRKNLIILAGFWPELKVIRKSVKDQNKLISLLLHYLDLLLNGNFFPESSGLILFTCRCVQKGHFTTS